MSHRPGRGLPASAADAWWFPYLPVPNAAGDDNGEVCDVVVAFRTSQELARARQVVEPNLADCEVSVLMDRAPLHWVRMRSEARVRREEVQGWFEAAGILVRYVASARRSSAALGVAAEFEATELARPAQWRAREQGTCHPDPDSPGRWFLGRSGVDVDRDLCGTGAGTRLAIVDDDAAQADLCELESEIPVEVESIPRAHSHGSLLAAWATRARTRTGKLFAGVAPDASPRLYCIPKAGTDVVSLPLAIVRAVFDGADVVVCATYVEGASSPMLDDALEAAVRLGRDGKGTLVVMPTGREASSPQGSVHASWTLGFGEPASDPRVMCIGPSSRDGGWFQWKDSMGRAHPFANRGPAVRWLAPGDDMAHPFSDRERLYHAESSGASAVAAGVLLLVIAANPNADWRHVAASVDATVMPVTSPAEEMADPWDMLPRGKDADGHDARQGYGRMDAARACMAVADPVCAALLDMGEEAAARRWLLWPAAWKRSFAASGRATELYRQSASFRQGLKALMRHLRLVSRHRRVAEHGAGVSKRQILLLLRELGVSSRGQARREAEAMMAAMSRADAHLTEEAVTGLARHLFVQEIAHGSLSEARQSDDQSEAVPRVA